MCKILTKEDQSDLLCLVKKINVQVSNTPTKGTCLLLNDFCVPFPWFAIYFLVIFVCFVD